MFAPRAPIMFRALKMLNGNTVKAVKNVSPIIQSTKSSGSWTYRTGAQPHSKKTIFFTEALGTCKWHTKKKINTNIFHFSQSFILK